MPLYISTEESLDFGNDAYLDWVLNTWMPNNYLDSTDSDPKQAHVVSARQWRVSSTIRQLRAGRCHLQKYTTDAGVQSAFKHMFDRFKARWPNKRILVSTGTLSYLTPAQQLPFMEDVLSHADGYFSEGLTNDHAYWNSQPNSDKRNAPQGHATTGRLAGGKRQIFLPQSWAWAIGTQPTQAETNYGYAFFNLLRRATNSSTLRSRRIRVEIGSRAFIRK